MRHMRTTPWVATALALVATIEMAGADPLGQPLLFPNPVLFASNTGAAAIGDLNQDQVPDLILVRGSATTVYVGQGNGLFSPGSSIATPTQPQQIVLADVDRDGWLDLVAMDLVSVRLYRGLGDGSFSVALVTSMLYNHWMAVGDLNHDGFLDVLLLASQYDSGVTANVPYTLMYQGPGSPFGPPIAVANSLYNPGKARVADMNGDGRQDLILVSGGIVSIRLALPSGRFAAGIETFATNVLYDFSIADMNRDGRPDVVANLYTSISFMLGDGLGHLSSVFGIGMAVPEGVIPFMVARTVDFDRDGNLDLAANGYRSLRLYRGRGDLTFEPPRTIPGLAERDLFESDVNLDGWKDLVAVTPGAVSALLNDPNHLFGPGVLGAPPGGAVFVRDLNADGRDDLLSAGTTLSAFLQTADGTFGPALPSTGAPADPTAANELHGKLFDADGDGKLDLAIATYRYTSTLLGHGDGMFGPVTTYNGGEIHDGLAPVGSSQDGTLGIATGCSGSVCIMPPLLSGWHYRIMEPGGVGSLVGGDLNQDGRPDLAGLRSSNPVDPYSAAQVFVLYGQPGGGMAAGETYDLAASAGAYKTITLDLQDVNADGRLDLLLLAHGPGLGVALGTGGGHLGAPTFVPTPLDQGTAITAADFDADGHLDVALALPPYLEILMGDGLGAFPRRQAFAALDLHAVTNESTVEPLMAVGQFDGDGFPDLALSSSRGAVDLLSSAGSPPTLHFPVAAAGPDRTAECASPAGATVLLDGAGSTDADSSPGTNDDIQTYEWFTGYATVNQALLATGPQPSVLLSPGAHTVTLLTTDRSTRVATDDVIITVQGAQCVSAAPVAAAGPDLVEECTGPAGGGVVLDGSASTDPDSTDGTNDDITSFDWFTGYGTPQQALLGSGRTLAVSLPVGSRIATLRTTDRWGLSSTDDVRVTVQDTTPPVLTAALDRTLLWPPNHRMVPVVAMASATDLCGAVTLVLNGIESTEPDDAEGDADAATWDDVQEANLQATDFVFALRAERDSNGPGRAYTVTYRAVDSQGNYADRPLTVIVPHDVGGVSDPVTLRVEMNEQGAIVKWDAVLGARWYNVVGGDLAWLRHLPGAPEFEAECLAAHVTGLDTSGSEVNFGPEVGQAYFFLVEYDDGAASGYGSANALYDVTPLAPSSACH